MLADKPRLKLFCFKHKINDTLDNRIINLIPEKQIQS